MSRIDAIYLCGMGKTQQQTLEWNAENRLVTVKNASGGVIESYAYDADGSRVKEVAGSKTTRTFFPFYVKEKVGTTTTIIKYYTFNGLTIAMKRGNDLRYLHSDHLGSNSVVTNADGTLHSSQDYCAYGGQRIATQFGYQCNTTANPLPTDRTFTGQEQDGTGLMYFRARYLDPVLGTFLSPDTIVPEPGVVFDYNRYMYVRGNALKYNDPSGHLSEDEIRKYYGYQGESRDALKEAMLGDGWDSGLADWLLNPDTQFGEVISYYDQAGSVQGEMMLALFEVGERKYQGGFYGMTGQRKGERVSRREVASFNDDTSNAVQLEKFYAGRFQNLPRKSGTDGRNYYDPAVFLDYDTADLASLGVTAVGAGATTVVAIGCVSTPIGWMACMGGAAGLIIDPNN